MTLKPRDRRALAMLGVSGILSLIYWGMTRSDSSTQVVQATESVSMVERRLAHLRQIVATGPAKEAALKQVSAELARREKSLIVADTAAQAQAQVIQILRRLASAETLEFRAQELGQVKPLGGHYGEAIVSVVFESRIDQLVNLLSAITAQPELIATEQLRIGIADPKQKTLNVQLTVSGVVPRKLVPEKKGEPSF